MSKKLGIAGLTVVLLFALVAGAIAPASSDRGDAVARLKDVNGDLVGVVRLSRTDKGKVAVSVRPEGIEPAGEFHGFHVHTTGKCDPDSVDPATGDTVPFFSAGGHFNPGSEVHGDHAGDLPTLLVNDDGTARLRFVTDRFELKDLFDDDGSAVIIHAGRDNYANIPATSPDGGHRYHSHLEDVFGPDSVTEATGDAGARFACGVVRRA
jgi:Cu-Zn family superoxide dismutase